jgi:hypothetical protein
MQTLLIRFVLIYGGLSAATSIIWTLLDIEGNSAVNTGVLMGAVMWVCLWFARENKRYFTPIEKRKAVLGMFLIDLMFQTVGVALARQGASSDLPAGTLLFGVLIVGAMNAAVIWISVGVAGKQLAKEVTSGS